MGEHSALGPPGLWLIVCSQVVAVVPVVPDTELGVVGHSVVPVDMTLVHSVVHCASVVDRVYGHPVVYSA